jgi:hypothetical protein
MDERKDDDDPTRVLDGWTPVRDAPDFDPTRVLDGWTPDADRETRRGDTSLPLIEAWQPLPADPPQRSNRLPDDLDLGVGTRQAKWDNQDVTDVDAIWRPSEAIAAAAEMNSDGWLPDPISAARRPDVPRLLAQWRPGAWIGAARSVFGTVAQVTSTPHGPVVDTFASHMLLALWPPQSLELPFLGRWPQRVLLSAAPAEDAGIELLKLLPADAELWLSEHDIDWALVGEAVLLHDPGLRDFQLKELRDFVESERQAAFERANQAYRLSAPGGPIDRT